jgi:hypothetical protein
LLLQPGEAIAGEGLQDMPDVLPGELQTAGNAPLVPALVVQAHDRPARLVGVIELVVVCQAAGAIARAAGAAPGTA